MSDFKLGLGFGALIAFVLTVTVLNIWFTDLYQKQTDLIRAQQEVINEIYTKRNTLWKKTQRVSKITIITATLVIIGIISYNVKALTPVQKAGFLLP